MGPIETKSPCRPRRAPRKPIDDVVGEVYGPQMSMLKCSWLMYLVQGMGEVQKKCRVKVGREGKGWLGSSICEG